MRLVKVLGVALVAVFAISAMAAAGASAHEFEASIVPTTLSASAEGTQAFTTKAGSLACTALTGSGTAEAKVAKTQKVSVSYTGCVASTGAVTAKPDEPITAEYEFNAEGTVNILKPITILALLGGVKCTITVQKQGPLSTVSYANKGTKEILLTANVTGIEYNAVGAGCKAGGTGTAKDGTYAGKSVTKGEGSGTLSWK